MMQDTCGFMNKERNTHEIQRSILRYKECGHRVNEVVIICDDKMVFKYVISKRELSTHSIDELLNIIPYGKTFYGVEIYLDCRKDVKEFLGIFKW